MWMGTWMRIVRAPSIWTMCLCVCVVFLKSLVCLCPGLAFPPLSASASVSDPAACVPQGPAHCLYIFLCVCHTPAVCCTHKSYDRLDPTTGVSWCAFPFNFHAHIGSRPSAGRVFIGTYYKRCDYAGCRRRTTVERVECSIDSRTFNRALYM